MKAFRRLNHFVLGIIHLVSDLLPAHSRIGGWWFWKIYDPYYQWAWKTFTEPWLKNG